MEMRITDDQEQLIGPSPAGIPLDRWREMFDAHNARQKQVPSIKAPALLFPTTQQWKNFEHFLNGKILANDYYNYATKDGVRSDIETVATALGDLLEDPKLDAYREALNKILYQRIQETRQDRHWQEEAADPHTRMYIEAARLINARLIRKISDFEKREHFFLVDAPKEAQIDDKITKAFDETILSPGIDIGNFDGFIANGIYKRLADLRLSWERRRISFVSLDDKKSRKLRAILAGETPERVTAHTLDEETLLNRIRRFATALPGSEGLAMTTFLDEKDKDDKITNAAMAKKIGMTEVAFNTFMRSARKKLRESHPSLMENVSHFFGGSSGLIYESTTQPSEKNSQNGHAVEMNPAASLPHKVRVKRLTSLIPSETPRNGHTIAPSHVERLSESDVGNKNTGVKKAKLDPRIRELKDEMHKLFEDARKGTKLNLSALARETGVKISHLSVLMGPESNIRPDRNILRNGVRSKLEAYLHATAGDKVDNFNRLVDEMRQIVHYTPRPPYRRGDIAR